ncbi:TadE/TadG family type IV pilus assembly protein [Actinospica robiniae]|uniref:TadE/TadG family type IV pilus assembly protein n=1 Tax=Actinospica robiniae TaxID=304901 RepID=UPI00041A757A|nr:TadE/TadG family type IV pilus assembly protein [Actinospica robiniae]
METYNDATAASLGDESGSVSVELTLLAGLLAVLALGLVQLAFLGYAREAAGYAAHDSLDAATAYGGSLAVAHDLGEQMLGQLTGTLHHPQVTVRRQGHEAVVTVTGQSTPLLGIAETITVTDTGPIQEFGAAG